MTTQTTTLAALRKPEAPTANVPAVRMGFDSADGFALMQRGANLLSSSDLVPQQYRGHVANSCIALNMASRMGADPLMVMQNLYVVHGRPGWSSQFLIATWNQCGRFTAIRYKFQGQPGTDEYGCRAWAQELSTGETLHGPLITIGLAKAEGWYQKQGSKWKTLPELMLTYRAASWLVRTYAPELAMGLQTREELQDVIDVEPGSDGVLRVREDQLRDVTASEAPSAAPVDISDATVVEEVAPQPEPEASAPAYHSTDENPPQAQWDEPEPQPRAQATQAAPARATANVRPRGIQVTYAMVRTALERAKDIASLELAGELIESVKADQRTELRAVLQQRREALGDDPGLI